MSKNESKKSPKKTSIKIIGTSVIFSVLLVWVIYPYIISFLNCYLVTSEKIPKLDLMTFGSSFGTFGDSFGALNTLFSGLAFAGIIISIFLQSEELTETREEIKAQKEEFEKQTAVFNQQTFENTFFKMLNLHNEVVQSIVFTKKSNNENTEIYSGRSSFKHLCETLKVMLSHVNFYRQTKNKILASIPALQTPCEAYYYFYIEYGSQLGNYFGNIYQILKFIDSSEIIKQEGKNFYINLLRTQISSNELLLLHLHLLNDEFCKKEFKLFAEKYAFFESLLITDMTAYYPDNGMIDEVVSDYELKAYGENVDLKQSYEQGCSRKKKLN